MKKNNVIPAIIILVLLMLLFLLRRCNQGSDSNQQPGNQRTENYSKRGLNRSPDEIKYSKHARCRMACRHITEKEVEEVLHDGTINYKKSELNMDECHKRYAVEDYVQSQHMRIIFAPCGNTVTVVTCIDLDKEWTCDCPGDNTH